MTSQKKPSKSSNVTQLSTSMTFPKAHWKLLGRALRLYADGVNPETKMKNIAKTLEEFGFVVTPELRLAFVENGRQEAANYELASGMAQKIEMALESQ